VVEWPERFPEALPAERLELRIEPVGGDARELHFTARGGRAQELLKEFEATWG